MSANDNAPKAAKGGITPSQTVGPYFHYALTPTDYPFTNWIATGDLVTPDTGGQKIRVEGRVLDGEGAPVPDAIVEIWQADANGVYPSPADNRARANSSFRGTGRAPSGTDGGFAFDTVKPGAVPGPQGQMQAPHINVLVLGRGLLKQLHTRIYFADEAGNAADPVLTLVADAARRATLIARPVAGRAGVYAFDIRLQGDGETVFFAV